MSDTVTIQVSEIENLIKMLKFFPEAEPKRLIGEKDEWRVIVGRDEIDNASVYR